MPASWRIAALSRALSAKAEFGRRFSVERPVHRVQHHAPPGHRPWLTPHTSRSGVNPGVCPQLEIAAWSPVLSSLCHIPSHLSSHVSPLAAPADLLYRHPVYCTGFGVGLHPAGLTPSITWSAALCKTLHFLGPAHPGYLAAHFGSQLCTHGRE